MNITARMARSIMGAMKPLALTDFESEIEESIGVAASMGMDRTVVRVRAVWWPHIDEVCTKLIRRGFEFRLEKDVPVGFTPNLYIMWGNDHVKG